MPISYYSFFKCTHMCIYIYAYMMVMYTQRDTHDLLTETQYF